MPEPRQLATWFAMLALFNVAMVATSAATQRAPAPQGGAGVGSWLPYAVVVGGPAPKAPSSPICDVGTSGPLPSSQNMGSPPVTTPAPTGTRATGPTPYCATTPAPVVFANAGNAPLLERVFPLSGHAGDHVTIQGRRFGPSPKVIFNGVPAQILRSSDTSITAVVPASTTFPIIVVTAGGATESADPFIYSLKTEDGLLHPIPVGGGWWFPDKPFWDAMPLDPVAKFLQNHWEQPLPPQGKPPVLYGAQEGDLRPESCANCHQPQYSAWKGSLHSTATTPLVRWIAREKDAKEADGCRRCHDPAAEPGAWTGVELYRARDDPNQRPRRDGVQCAVCHVRESVLYGPPALPRVGPPANAVPVHGGLRREKAYEDSRFCAGCHTFVPRVTPGGMVGDPFGEWLASRFAREGVSCQNCHMPQRQHLFRGIHDREMTLSGLTIGLTVVLDQPGQATATATITSTNVGHMFPTYPVPRVHVQLLCDEKPLGEEYVIGRDVDLPKSVENWDRRLAPGQSYVMRRQFQAGQQVTLRIDVVPRDRYEKDLRIQLAAAQRVPGHVFLGTVQQLLEHETSLRYRLVDISVPVPPQAGIAQRVLKEGRYVADQANP